MTGPAIRSLRAGSPKPVERRGRVVLVVVVGIGEDGSSLLEKATYEIRPPPQVVVALPPEVRVSRRELAPVTEPADVGEVRRRLLHAGHSRIVDESEGRTTLAQHLGEIRAKPAPVTNLDGVAKSLGQAFQEIFEYAHALDVEGWRELKKERAKPVSQLRHRTHEAFGLGFGADEVSLVRHLLRKLRSEEEAVRDDLTPLLHRRAARGAVEGRVYLHGREVLRVLGEPRSGREGFGVEGSFPVRIRPAGGSQVKALLRRLDAARSLREEPLLRRIVHLPSKLRCYHTSPCGFYECSSCSPPPHVLH